MESLWQYCLDQWEGVYVGGSQWQAGVGCLSKEGEQSSDAAGVHLPRLHNYISSNTLS